MGDQPRRIYEFGRFRLDATERVLFRDREPVALTPKAIDTLIVLVENSGHVVEKDELMTAIWPDTFVGEDSLTRNVSLLRRVLSDEGSDPQYIETLPRRGYRFATGVKHLEDDEEVIVRRRGRVRIITEEESDEPRTLLAAQRLGLPEAARPLAVLPFKLLGVDAADEYLSIGIADALITKLSNIRRIVVRPTSAVIRYDGVNPDVRMIGQRLRVESVLEGSIQKLGDRIRVTVQLVSVEEGAPQWAAQFDEKFTDIFQIEDGVSEQVVAALTSKLSGEESRLLTKRHTADFEAHQSYLKGRYFWNKRTPDGLDKAVECFEQAIARDPGYALAYAGLADCYNMSGFWVYLPPNEAFPRAAAAANKALNLDNSLSEAHASLAWATLHYQWDRVTSEREYKLAIELNPGYLTAHQWYALFLMQEARFDEAFRELTRAEEIDPLSLAVSFNLGLLLLFRKRYDEAIEQLQRTLDLDPNYFIARNFLALSYWFKSMPDECLAEYQRCVDCSPASLPALGLGFALTGRNAEARAVLDELEDGVSHAYVSPTSLAQIYLNLGEKNRALECLERACEERDPWSLWNKVNPVFEPLHSDRRFQNLLARLGLGF